MSADDTRRLASRIADALERLTFTMGMPRGDRDVLDIAAAWIRDLEPTACEASEALRAAAFEAMAPPVGEPVVLAVHARPLDDCLVDTAREPAGIPSQWTERNASAYVDGWRDGMNELARRIGDLPRHPVRG